MTFLWPLSLLFGLTALVPLALHLYQQQQRRVIEFSTDRFFTKSVVRAQRRLRLRQWILLLLRMVACLLVALAAAQPIADWFSPPGGHEGRRDVVILLDDSLSMAARPSPDEPTHFDQAKQTAQAILGQLSPGDRAAIVRLSDAQILYPLTNGSDIHLNEEEPVSLKAAHIAASLKQAANLLAAGDAAAGRHPLAILLTDGQKANFPDILRPTPRQPIPLLIQPIRQPTTHDTGVGSLWLEPANLWVHQTGSVTARFFNHRATNVTGAWVLEQDGREIRRQTVTLPAQGETTAHGPVIFDQTGNHRLTVRLDVADALAENNLRQIDVTVGSSLGVLLVDAMSQHGRVGRQSPAFFIEAALTAATDSSNPPSALGPQVIAPPQLDHTTLDNHRMIVFASWPSPSESQMDRLTGFMNQGGTILFFSGDLPESQSTPHPLDRWLNIQMIPPGHDASLDAAGEKPLTISPDSFTGPMLKNLDAAALAGVEIHRRWRIESDQATCLIRLSDGSPWLLKRSIGQGQLLIVASSLSPNWTNLPRRKLFVPLMQNLVRSLSEPAAPVGSNLSSDDRPTLVSPPAGELTTAIVRQTDLQPLAESWQVHLLPPSSDDPMATAARIQSAMDQLPGRGRLWDLLLRALLAVLLVEPLLANWRRRLAAERLAETEAVQ